eukprot:2604061-Alexandrium_andersonii.AAC.1
MRQHLACFPPASGALRKLSGSPEALRKLSGVSPEALWKLSGSSPEALPRRSGGSQEALPLGRLSGGPPEAQAVR